MFAIDATVPSNRKLRPRALAALKREGCFIFNETFPSLDPDEVLAFPTDMPLYVDGMQPGLAEMTEVGSFEALQAMPVLSPEGEQFLFRKLNYLRYLVNVRRAALSIDEPQSQALEEIEELLADADAVRNHIAECNLRLIASIARKFATSQTDFDELVSEANMILLKAIDKFDYARGFRFSTYLTHSVQRHFYRLSRTRQRRQARELPSSGEIVNAAPEPEDETTTDELLRSDRSLQALVSRMDECLDEREQYVMRERFGLGNGRAGRTLRDIAGDVGLSKERVRQIQIVAVQKLREFFERLQSELACA